MADAIDLSGIRCLVTGATGAFGRTVAAKLRACGAELVLTGRSAAALDALAAALAETPGGTVDTVALDLAEPEAVEQLIRATGGRLDVLVNNAAIQGPIAPFAEGDFAAWTETVRLNLVVPAELCRAVVGALEARAAAHRRRSKIINLSGGGATGARPNFSAYAVAKTGLVRLTEILAEELRERGIDINAVAPGAMPSAMTHSILAAGPALCTARELDLAQQAHGEAGGAAMDRASDLVAYLASSESDGITGKLIAAQWDPWPRFGALRDTLAATDIYTLRRIVPADRGQDWS